MKKQIIIICYVIIAVGIVLLYSSCKDSQNAQQSWLTLKINRLKNQKPLSAKPEETAQKQDEVPTVEIPLEKQQLIGVRTVTASVQPLQKTIRTTGKIEYDERKLTTINTKVEGWIEKLYVNFNGIYVKKGEPLADLYSPELWATQQEFINLVRWAKKTDNRVADSAKTVTTPQGETSKNLTAMLSKDADSLMEAARQRLKLWDISDEQIKKD